MGAPRCGTTSLSKTLAAHPQVCFSKPKETHYFARAASGASPGQLQKEFFRRYFVGQTVAGRFIGEGSVSSLYLPGALREIQRFDPAARFLVAVRNPLEMIDSYHSRLLYTLDEDIEDLATAWSMQAERQQGRNIPARCREPALLQYGEMGLLGKHVGRLFETVGRENCLVVVHEDLTARPSELYREILTFIGLDDDGRQTFLHKNANLGYRSKWLQRYVMNPPAWISKMIQNRQASGTDSMRTLRDLRKRIKRNNRKKVDRPALPAALRAELAEYFAEDVKQLSALLDRNLQHWL